MTGNRFAYLLMEHLSEGAINKTVVLKGLNEHVGFVEALENFPLDLARFPCSTERATDGVLDRHRTFVEMGAYKVSTAVNSYRIAPLPPPFLVPSGQVAKVGGLPTTQHDQSTCPKQRDIFVICTWVAKDRGPGTWDMGNGQRITGPRGSRSCPLCALSSLGTTEAERDSALGGAIGIDEKSTRSSCSLLMRLVSGSGLKAVSPARLYVIVAW